MARLYRDRWDKKIAGVCGGIGQYLKLDPAIIRLLAVFICAITAFLPLIVLYIIAWMLMPLGPPSYVLYDCNRLYRSVRNRKISGVCGGIAETLKIDAIIVRLVIVIVLIPTGFFPIMLTYIIAILTVSENPEGRA